MMVRMPATTPAPLLARTNSPCSRYVMDEPAAMREIPVMTQQMMPIQQSTFAST